MNLGPHAAFIVAAYLAAGVVMALLIVWVIADGRNQRRALDEMEKRTGRGARAKGEAG